MSKLKCFIPAKKFKIDPIFPKHKGIGTVFPEIAIASDSPGSKLTSPSRRSTTSAISSSEVVAYDLMRQTLGEAEGQLDDTLLKSQRKFYQAILERSAKHNA